MDIKQDSFFPQFHYFDTDFINLYEQTWARIEKNWIPPNTNKPNLPSGYVKHSDSFTVDLFESAMSSFFLLYSNDYFSATSILDFFYAKQETNGAIYCTYSIESGEVTFPWGNPEGISPPVLVWAEHNNFNKTDNKRRIKEILPKLDKYLDWLKSVTQQQNGLFVIPPQASYMGNIPRKNAVYYIDFNSQMAIAYYFMIKLAIASNFRNLVFKYTGAYYKFKATINKYFWDKKDNFYFDLDSKLQPIKLKTISSFWTLLAQIPNNTQAEYLRDSLNNSLEFFTPNSFPTLSQNHPNYSEQGLGHRGSVYPLLTYMIVNGLCLYGFSDFARESAVRHISSILATFYSEEENIAGNFWEAYQPHAHLPAKPSNKNHPIRKNYFPSIAIATITLMIEYILGFDICLPKKMVFWTIPHLEFMGIESFQLKRNTISTILQQSSRGWEIRHGSEKLYYFTVTISEKNIKKTLPIPSGKCSLLVDKL